MVIFAQLLVPFSQEDIDNALHLPFSMKEAKREPGSVNVNNPGNALQLVELADILAILWVV